MAEISSRVNPLFLREEELHQGMELLLFAYRDFMAEADGLLAERGLGRAHHRAAYFIGRHPDISVSELLGLLGITKQSLSRVLNSLVDAKYVEVRPGPNDRRQRLLSLTESGRELERALTHNQRHHFARAYREAGAEAVDGFRKVLAGLVGDDRRMRLPRAGTETGANTGAKTREGGG
ncbi:MAG: MarR family transcriptional regulator [Alphaproteobacteria bacterium]|nr:MarR family transcriptional regulator [Alphaproteobacteria bacterium]